MNTKLTSLCAVGLLIGAGLISLLSFSGCGSIHTDNISERPWNEPRGFQYRGNDRRDR